MVAAFTAFIFLIFLFTIIKPALNWALNKKDPFILREKILFKDSKYHDEFENRFRKVCEKAKLNYDSLKIYILLSDNPNLIYINASAWQTVRTKSSVYMEEGAFIYFESYPEVIEAIFAHEVGHLKKGDPLWKQLISEYGPSIVPFGFFCTLVILGYYLDYFIRIIPNQYSSILLLLEVLLLIIGIPTFIFLFLTNGLIPVWHFQISEIRADIFAANICGKEPVDLFLSVLEENEKVALEQYSLFERIKVIYSARLNEHPSASFRREQVQKVDRVTTSFKMKHYFRLLIWLSTGRGFYGEYVFLKARKSITS